MNRDLLNRLANEFAALDVSAESERIAEVQCEIESADVAIARAEARCTELAQMLVDYRGPDGGQVADALMGEVSTIDAARAGNRIEDMQAERASLREGIRVLKLRVEDWNSEIQAAKMAAMGQAARLTQPLVDSITAEAKDAAEKLLTCYAAVHAIGLGVRVGSQAADQLRYAAEGIMGQRRLLSWRRAIPVPQEIDELLEVLSDKGEALLVRRTATAPGPEIAEDYGTIAVVGAR